MRRKTGSCYCASIRAPAPILLGVPCNRSIRRTFTLGEAVMATLVLDRSDLELRADGSALALYESGGRSGTIPLALLDRVVLQGAAIRLETGVLTRLAEAGVTTLLLSARHSRRLALVLGPAHNDAAVRLLPWPGGAGGG